MSKKVKCRCKRNVTMLGVAFLFNFTAYMTLESMQSSLNQGLGTTSLSFLYTSIVVSALFIPPLAIAKLDCRKSLALSVLSYTLYTLANFYPVPYTLIPAALLLGMGASVFWAAGFYYIIQLAQKHADERGKSHEEVMGAFFGKFTSISHFSILIGTLFMSVVFEVLGIRSVYGEADILNQNETYSTMETTMLNNVATMQDIMSNNVATMQDIMSNNVATMQDIMSNNASTMQDTMPNNVTMSQATMSNNVTMPLTTILTNVTPDSHVQCGINYKYFAAPKRENSVDPVIMYVLLSGYLLCNVIAIALCLCLDEVGGLETQVDTDDVISASMASLNNALTTPPDAVKHDNNNKNADSSVFKLVRSTLMLLVTDKAAVLLIPFTLHYGMIQGFVRGLFNASWIACSLGVQYVAYVTGVYGAVMIAFCFLFGRVLRFTTHARIFAVTMTMEVALFVVTLLWQPSVAGETWVYFAIPVGFGISHSSLSSQLGGVYGKFFRDNKKAGTALLGVWNPMGSAIAYGLSGVFYPVHVVAMVMSMCVVGTILYLVAENIKDDPSARKFCC